MRSLKGCHSFSMCCISARCARLLYLKFTTRRASASARPLAFLNTSTPLIALPSRSTPMRRFWQSQQRPSRRELTRGRYSSVQVEHLRSIASNTLISSCSAHSSVSTSPGLACSHSSASRSDAVKAGSAPPRMASHHIHSPSSSSSSPSKSTAQSAHGLAASLVFASSFAIMASGNLHYRGRGPGSSDSLGPYLFAPSSRSPLFPGYVLHRHLPCLPLIVGFDGDGTPHIEYGH